MSANAINFSHFGLPSQSQPIRSSHQQMESSPSIEADDATRSPEPEVSTSHLARSIKLGATIVGFMGVGGGIAATVSLKSGLVLPGACIAWLMMIFIGMPLILASIADARDAAE